MSDIYYEPSQFVATLNENTLRKLILFAGNALPPPPPSTEELRRNSDWKNLHIAIIMCGLSIFSYS